MHKAKTIHFEWDENKNSSNIKKHQISFEEAKTIFDDPFARLISDPDHSQEEDRFVLLGMSDTLHMLVVCHCYRRQDSIIRLISAREANRHEQAIYEEHRK